MTAEWKYTIPLVCGEQDGVAIFGIVEDFARRSNVMWYEEAARAKSAVFIFGNEAYNIPRAKIPKFVRFVCKWFAEAVADRAKEEGERIASTTVTVCNISGFFQSTFELTVSWHDWEYTLRQYLIPRHGDEAFYDWDDDAKEGGAK